MSRDLIGKTVGHFRIDALLGEGGMGRVFRGFDTRLQRPVAIKTVRRSAGLPEESRHRFVQEARVLSKLNHPNICQVYDLLEDDSRDLLVLELIEGKTLAAAMAEGLTQEERLEVAQAVVEAVSAAHRENIVHRDLKPDNVMITTEGVVKVLDFGLAQPSSALGTLRSVAPYDLSLAQVEDPDRTAPEPVRARPSKKREEASDRQRTAVGTLSYMSPEQARLEPVSMASDIYSLGILLQELFTGRRAFQKVSGEELLKRVRQGRTEPYDDLDKELAELLQDLQRQTPSRRPVAEEIAGRLRAYGAAPAERRRRRLKAAVGALVGALILLAAGSFLFSRFQARRQAFLAQQFTEEANDIESALRMAYLAPVHDLRPTLKAVRSRMALLEEEMDGRRSPGWGPGTYALGRVALALHDYETARDHFQASWKADYRTPEVASGLGVATFEVYRRQLSSLERSGPLPKEELERLHSRLRDPSLGYLGLGERALRSRQGDLEAEARGRVLRPIESLDYVEALRAFNEERFADALVHARASMAGAPLFFEGQLLQGKILGTRGDRLHGRADYSGATQAYEAARKALLAAAEVGRSSPAVFLELCGVGLSRTILELYHGRGETFDESFLEGTGACSTALTINPEDSVGLYRLADLKLRKAESLGDTEESRRLLLEAQGLLEQSLTADREDGEAWKILGHLEMVQSDWNINYGRFDGEEVMPRIRRAQEAYREAYRRRPEDYRILNSLANSHSLEAEALARTGADPTRALAESIEAYRRAMDLAPSVTMPRSNLLLALGFKAQLLVQAGKDPQPVLETAVEEYEALLRVAKEGSYHSGFRSYAEVCNIAAGWNLLQGESPEPWLSKALDALEIAADTDRIGNFELRVLAQSLSLRAEHSLVSGKDPRPDLEALRKQLHPAAAELDDPILKGLLASTYVLEARWDLAQGDSPEDAYRLGFAGLGALIEAGADLPRALLQRAELRILEARRLKTQGRSVGAAIGAARRDVQEARAVDSRSFLVPLVGARIERWVLEIGSREGRARRRAVELGREHLEILGALHPELSEAEALAAVFDAEEDPSRQEQAGRRLTRALDENPFLRFDYGGSLRRRDLEG